MNIFNDIIYPFFNVLKDMASGLYDFLFNSVIEIGDFSLSGIGLLGAGTISVILIWVIVKTVI